MEKWKKLSLFLICLLVWVPVLILLSSSFMGKQELLNRFSSLFGMQTGIVKPAFIPSYPTFRSYMELLLDSPEFFVMFWNSMLQTVPVLAGQTAVAVLAAWAFGIYEFKGKKILYSLYIIVMILPFQVTMVSSYFVLDTLKLMNHQLALILPGIFSALPVFIITKSFSGIPKALIEAARMDGAKEWRIFMFIGIPLGKAGIFSALLLGFFEQWNALEQPLTFLKDKSLWPLSLFLPNITPEAAALSFGAAAIMMIPCILLSIMGEEYLKEGILASGIKE